MNHLDSNVISSLTGLQGAYCMCAVNEVDGQRLDKISEGLAITCSTASTSGLYWQLAEVPGVGWVSIRLAAIPPTSGLDPLCWVSSYFRTAQHTLRTQPDHSWSCLDSKLISPRLEADLALTQSSFHTPHSTCTLCPPRDLHLRSHLMMCQLRSKYNCRIL